MASGQSRRFDANKLLADFQGRPMIETVFDQFPCELFHQTVVVTRYPEVAVSAAMHGFCIAENEDESFDVAKTIRLGIQSLRPRIMGCLFAVCDQPMLHPESIQAIVRTFYKDPHKMVALGFGERRGNPVMFPKKFFYELSNLPAHQGGSAVIKKHLNDLCVVQAQQIQELWDIDRPEDLLSLCNV